jgi:hypothetical protein
MYDSTETQQKSRITSSNISPEIIGSGQEFGIITRVENQDILLPIDVELLHKSAHFIFVVADGIESEILVSVHVVDVIPHGIQGDVCLLVVLHHRLELIYSVVTPPALVETYTQP